MSNKFILLGKFLKLIKVFFSGSHPKGIYVSYSHEIKNNDLANFEDLIKHISKDHKFISPESFFEYLENGILPADKSVLMTFDDGFISSYNAAKNILNKYGIKAIFFIPTAILNLKTDKEMIEFTRRNIYFNTINEKELVPEEYLFIKENHLIDLANDGHMICPHTYSHIWIKDIVNDKMAVTELVEPKKLIEKLLKKTVRVFAFPVGTERQAGKFAYEQICRNYDYCFTALTGNNSYGGNKYKLHRFNLPADATKSYVDMALQGIYNPYYKYKMKLLSRKVD